MTKRLTESCEAIQAPTRYRWTECMPPLNGRGVPRDTMLIGVVPGQGIGPEVVSAALKVVQSVAAEGGATVELRWGGIVGPDAERIFGRVLPDAVVEFCSDVFTSGGVVINGAAGGRYVYDIRRQFDMYFKISPIRVVNGLADASRLKAESLAGVDILVARENTGGAYQGTWAVDGAAANGRVATHTATYSDHQVRRFLDAAARLALQRSGSLTVVWKESGIPAISKQWRDCAEDVADRHGVRFAMIDCDLMAYRLIQDAAQFDVVAAPNLFGDILADLAAVLLGSRGQSYSGNYNELGHAIYQTNHGAAYDLAGTDRANPAGQIFSAAMMLRESFGQWRMADAVEQAVRAVWRDGFRTEDVASPGTRIIGTQEMADRVAAKAAEIMSKFSKAN